MKPSLVSIIIPCYNQSQYLEECLQSVLNQTYVAWECIIVNDGSPDNTKEIAARWALNDSRFKLVNKQNGGLSTARNEGLKHVNGEWVLFLDCDDKISTDKLQHASKYFSTYDVIVSNYKLFTGNKDIGQFCDYLHEQLSFRSILLNWDLNYSIPIHCAIFRNNNLPRFNEEIKAKEDWLFWLSVFRSDVSYVIYPDIDAYYRVHEHSMTKNLSFMLQNEEAAYSYIYSQLDVDLQAEFFTNRLSYKNTLLIDKERQIQNLIEKLEDSKSTAYKLARKLFYKIKNIRTHE